MIEEKFYDIIFNFHNGDIKVENFSKKTFNISFFTPDNGFFGCNHPNFSPNTWIKTNPKTWEEGKANEEVKIIIVSSDSRYEIMFNYNKKEFIDVTDSYCKINNYEIVKKKISIVITAFDSSDYIDETLNKFIDIINKKEHLEVEILIGIDGCFSTFKHVASKTYPNYVHFLFSEKNYGMSIMKNSLVYNTCNEKVLIFDSDDIPTENLIDMVHDELDNNDFIYYQHYEFKDGEDYNNSDNLKPIKSNYMGGTLGMNRERFLEINGFFPWKVQSDDEFKNRVKKNKEKYKVLDNFLFYYRIRKKSLSRDKKFGKESKIRRTYLDIMTSKTIHGFENPEIFKYNDKLIYIQ